MPSFISSLGGSAQPDSSLTLGPGGTAVFFIEVPNLTSTSQCASPSRADVGLPGIGAFVPIGLSVPSLSVCPDESAPTGPSQATIAEPVYVTPISLASSPLATPSSGASPLGDGTGFHYGADSGGAPCEDYSPYQIVYNGLTGGCGFYGGQMGAYWELWVAATVAGRGMPPRQTRQTTSTLAESERLVCTSWAARAQTPT
jgi:hypothetical protein